VNFYSCLYSLLIAQGKHLLAASSQYKLYLRIEAEARPWTLAVLQLQQEALLTALNSLLLVPEAERVFAVQDKTVSRKRERSSPATAAADRTGSSSSRAAAAGAAAALAAGSSSGSSEQAAFAAAHALLTVALKRAAVEDGSVEHISERTVQAKLALVRARVLLTESAAPSSSALAQPHKLSGSRAGSEEALAELLRRGLFEAAVDFVQQYWQSAAAAVQRTAKLSEVVAVLAHTCARLQAATGDNGSSDDAALPLVISDAHTPWVAAAGSSPAQRKAAAGWLLLQEVLYRLDFSSNSSSSTSASSITGSTALQYHAAAARALLHTAPELALPLWLEAAFEGRRPALPGAPEPPAAAFPPWTAFTSSSAHPALLLNLLVEAGQLSRACAVLCRLLHTSAVDAEALTDGQQQQQWLPEYAVTRLVCACEAALSSGSAGPELREQLEAVQSALKLFRDTAELSAQYSASQKQASAGFSQQRLGQQQQEFGDVMIETIE
jgi:hypothetical protein